MAKLNVDLVKEWHPTRNGNLNACDVESKSNKKVWWRCRENHEWQATIYHRTAGTNCPYCSGKKAIKGENDLGTLNPQLAKEWNFARNGSLKPEDVKTNSNRKVWWQCENGHEWVAKISARTRGQGCPYDSGLRAIKGETDLATTHPELAKEWHSIRNRPLTTNDVKAGSDKKVWWQCIKGHEWLASISSRKKKGCPYCSGNLVIKGETDLATVNPVLAKEWHHVKNGPLKPHDVTSQSHKIVWWKCSAGHAWKRSVHGRANKSKCPYCSGRFAVQGKTDLFTVNPVLAKEWHYEKNGSITPKDVTISSHKKVWWKCENGHEWEATIYSRKKSNCPYCSGKLAIRGENDLATVNPFLAEEWHSRKNGQLRPEDVKSKSNKKVWWFCSQNHEWRASIYDRSLGSGCPICR